MEASLNLLMTQNTIFDKHILYIFLKQGSECLWGVLQVRKTSLTGCLLKCLGIVVTLVTDGLGSGNLLAKCFKDCRFLFLSSFEFCDNSVRYFVKSFGHKGVEHHVRYRGSLG